MQRRLRPAVRAPREAVGDQFLSDAVSIIKKETKAEGIQPLSCPQLDPLLLAQLALLSPFLLPAHWTSSLVVS